MKNRLKVLRAERDWSQADLAARLDVSRQSVNAIETGKYDPSLPLAFKIARLFDQPIEAIFSEILSPKIPAHPGESRDPGKKQLQARRTWPVRRAPQAKKH